VPDLSLDPDSAALTIINGRAESRVHQQAGRSYRLQLHFYIL
jgi:hypothetical protein